MTHIDITNISLGERYKPKQQMLAQLAKDITPDTILKRVPRELAQAIPSTQLGDLDSTIKNRGNIPLERAFAGMLHVVAATNNLVRQALFPKMSFAEAVAKGSYFLTLMAAKEALVGLTPEEIAGMVLAGHLDLVYVPPLDSCIETSGMGGDRGWGTKRVKTINASTLSAIVTAAMGYTSMKHGSYGNTTKVGSTDVPEQFGINLSQTTPQEICHLLRTCNFWFNDAHAVKTLHYLSHLLMVETVNHIVGPMTPPIGSRTKLFKVMGVNHHVHPSTIAKAYVLLHSLNAVNLGGVVVLGGVNKVPIAAQVTDQKWFRKHSYLDEVSPTATLVSMASGSEFLGTTVLQGGQPFGIQINPANIKVENTIETLMAANERALTGGHLAEYLACNVALTLLSQQLRSQGYRKNLLKENFSRALDTIESGAAMALLNRYIVATGGKRVHWSK